MVWLDRRKPPAMDHGLTGTDTSPGLKTLISTLTDLSQSKSTLQREDVYTAMCWSVFVCQAVWCVQMCQISCFEIMNERVIVELTGTAIDRVGIPCQRGGPLQGRGKPVFQHQHHWNGSDTHDCILSTYMQHAYQAQA